LRLCACAPLRLCACAPLRLCAFAWEIFFRLAVFDRMYYFLCKAQCNNVILLQPEAANRVFADAAEVEGVVVFDDVGDLGVAIGGAVLEVFDDAAVRV
jgi:hypothetical protein